MSDSGRAGGASCAAAVAVVTVAFVLVVAGAGYDRGPLAAFFEGPWSPRARRELATWVLGQQDLEAGAGRWRAYSRVEFDFQGDYDRWYRLDRATAAEVAQVASRLGAQPLLSVEMSDRCKSSGPGPRRWWPQDLGGARLRGASGVPAAGSCWWLDETSRRLLVYAWKF